MKKLLTFLSASFIINSSYPLYIRWNNEPIDSEAKHDTFISRVKNEPQFAEYLKIRETIAEASSLEGPRIAPHWGVFGAHFEGFSLKNIEEGCYYVTNIMTLDSFNRSNVIHIDNTDLALTYFFSFSENGVKEFPKVDLPILERATVNEIKDDGNRLYALSCTLNGLGLADGKSFLDSKYCHVVRCKPTLDDPQDQPKLRFEIDDSNNFRIEFRTAVGDSCQPFFMVTPDKQVKLVGTHNPSNNAFIVENIAYPSTKLFIDSVILQKTLGE